MPDLTNMANADLKALIRGTAQAQYDEITDPASIAVTEQYNGASVKGVIPEIVVAQVDPLDPAIEALNDEIVDQGSVFLQDDPNAPPP